MTKNKYPGKFIVFEGLDGAGKSTQAGLLNGYLAGVAQRSYLTSEPSQFLVGGIVRSRLLGEWQSSPECLQLLFAADRDQHLEKEIVPRLEAGMAVVADRYFMSSIAYGAVECDFDWLAQVNRNFLIPDLTVYLDVPASVCVQRIADNGKSIELFEKKNVLERVSENYRKAIDIFQKDMRIAAIDAARSRDDVFGDIKNLIDNFAK
ncbi:MAG: dTMP kinase [Candidatus Paceibacterota bacterium]